MQAATNEPRPMANLAILVTPCPEVNSSEKSTVAGEALHRHNDVSRVASAKAPAVSVLAQVDPLPRAKGELAICDRDVDRRSD